MIAKVIYGSHPLRYEAAMYQPTSLVWGATGRGILAFLPEEVIDTVLAKEDPSPASGRKMGKPSQIKSDLAQIRAQGYAHSRGQKVVGAEGFSAPVFDANGVIGALCITLPQSRFKDSMQPRFARTLMDQAARFSNTLGHRSGALKAAAKR
jgi:DNA-binding IclR family transcriptional regulator